MTKRIVSAKSLARDVRQGMTPSELAEKYQVSADTLLSFSRKLVDAGLLAEAEVQELLAISDQKEVKFADSALRDHRRPDSTPLNQKFQTMTEERNGILKWLEYIREKSQEFLRDLRSKSFGEIICVIGVFALVVVPSIGLVAFMVWDVARPVHSEC